MKLINGKRYYTVSEVARALGVSREAVHNRVARGTLRTESVVAREMIPYAEALRAISAKDPAVGRAFAAEQGEDDGS